MTRRLFLVCAMLLTLAGAGCGSKGSTRTDGMATPPDSADPGTGPVEPDAGVPNPEVDANTTATGGQAGATDARGAGGGGSTGGAPGGGTTMTSRATGDTDGGLGGSAGTIFYLATGGPDRPWATFAHAFSQMNPGDTLVVKDGTCPQSVTKVPSGTESRYTVIDEDLWPFPNEAQIRKDMRSYTGPQEGKRGFCADGTRMRGGAITLTSYIWEYLGHECPAEVCR